MLRKPNAVAPPLDPPGVVVKLPGYRAVPYRLDDVDPFQFSSGLVVLHVAI